MAEEEDKIYVSPYNDPIVVGGQGTCSYEISKQLPDLDAAFFVCGAGGLLTGSAGWLKSHNPDVEAFGVSPENSPVMCESMRSNKMVEIETYPTLADTCAGGVDLDSITLELCQRYVEELQRGLAPGFPRHVIKPNASPRNHDSGLDRLGTRMKINPTLGSWKLSAKAPPGRASAGPDPTRTRRAGNPDLGQEKRRVPIRVRVF